MASVPPHTNTCLKTNAYFPNANIPLTYYGVTGNESRHLMPERSPQGWSPNNIPGQQTPSAYGFNGNQQYVMMVPGNTAPMPNNAFFQHQQYTMMQVMDPNGNLYLGSFVPAQQCGMQMQAPDSRLNPNSREFVKNPTVINQARVNRDKAIEQSRKTSSEHGSISSGATSGRNLSSDSLVNNLSVKLRSLDLRYHSGDSGDSGIAETLSSSSPTWSSDDDTDGCGRSSRREETKTPEEETVWTVYDDNLYWKNERRIPPSEALCYAIVRQLEYYMSDEYLIKDKYLLRQIRCKKDGYVSIKLMTSFKKMKKLAQDWPVLRSAITRKSKTIVVSPEGLRIRRRVQLSEELRKPRMLTSVLAIRLPEQYNAVDRVTSLFRVFGEIGFVRLLRQDKPVPVDLRNYATQVPDIGLSLCAVIEFESGTDALSAVRVLKQRRKDGKSDSSDGGTEAEGDKTKEAEISAEDNEKLELIVNGMPDLCDMRLALLGPRVRRTLYRQDRTKSSDSLPSSSRNISLESNAGKATDMLAHTWRSSRPILVSPNKRTNVIRQPRGPLESKGFKMHRTIRHN